MATQGNAGANLLSTEILPAYDAADAPTQGPDFATIQADAAQAKYTLLRVKTQGLPRADACDPCTLQSSTARPFVHLTGLAGGSMVKTSSSPEHLVALSTQVISPAYTEGGSPNLFRISNPSNVRSLFQPGAPQAPAAAMLNNANAENNTQGERAAQVTKYYSSLNLPVSARFHTSSQSHRPLKEASNLANVPRGTSAMMAAPPTAAKSSRPAAQPAPKQGGERRAPLLVQRSHSGSARTGSDAATLTHLDTPRARAHVPEQFTSQVSARRQPDAEGFHTADEGDEALIAGENWSSDEEGPDGKRQKGNGGVRVAKAGGLAAGASASASVRKASRVACRNCGVTQTPQWRSGPEGPRTLCNACGVRYKKGLPIAYWEKKKVQLGLK